MFRNIDDNHCFLKYLLHFQYKNNFLLSIIIIIISLIDIMQ